VTDLDRDALDRYITGGRYRKEHGDVQCGECEEWTPVTAETDYGATEWSPAECKHCGHEFTGEERWEDPEPPERDHHEESGRFEPW
jgi:hypothetical protein